MLNFNQFLLWERASRDTIDFKKTYVDMADNLTAGLLLSQIVYWHLPDKQGHTKLRVRHKGHLWLAKQRNQWWDEIRLTPRQVDRATEKLIKKNLIVKAQTMFNNKRTILIRLNEAVFLEAWGAVTVKPVLPNGKTGITKRLNRSDTNVETGFDKTGKPITETTSEITTETSPVVVPNEIMCSTHHSMMRKRSNEQGEIWYSHKVGNDWCQGAPDDQLDLKQEPEDDSRRYITGKYKDSLMY